MTHYILAENQHPLKALLGALEQVPWLRVRYVAGRKEIITTAFVPRKMSLEQAFAKVCARLKHELGAAFEAANRDLFHKKRVQGMVSVITALHGKQIAKIGLWMQLPTKAEKQHRKMEIEAKRRERKAEIARRQPAAKRRMHLWFFRARPGKEIHDPPLVRALAGALITALSWSGTVQDFVLAPRKK